MLWQSCTPINCRIARFGTDCPSSLATVLSIACWQSSFLDIVITLAHLRVIASGFFGAYMLFITA